MDITRIRGARWMVPLRYILLVWVDMCLCVHDIVYVYNIRCKA